MGLLFKVNSSFVISHFFDAHTSTVAITVPEPEPVILTRPFMRPAIGRCLLL